MLNIDKENLFELSKTDKLAKKYYDKLMELNTNQEFVGLLSNDEEYEMYVKSEISEARENARKEGIDIGVKRGIKQGTLQGIEQGSKESKLEIAKAMLSNHEDLEKIMTYTGLTEIELKALQD